MAITDEELAFCDEVLDAQELWAAMNGPSLYLLAENSGNAVPVWSSFSKAAEALKVLDNGVSPISVPLRLFVSNWLASSDFNIVAVLANPVFSKPEALTFSNGEFVAKFKAI